VQQHGKAGAADRFQQVVEAVETWLGCQFGRFAVVAHGAEEAAHLGERRTAGLLDVSERIAVLLERLRQLVPDGADLKDHHADGVGDDVVELTRDARALLGNCEACSRLALALGLGRAFFCRFGLLGALAQGKAREPADPEEERDEEELAGRVCGLVVDDDRRTADDHGQGDPRLQGVAQVPEQERGAIPRTKTLSTKGISRPSTNASPAASIQYAVAAAKGKRRRAKSGSTSTATAGTENHRLVAGAPGKSRPTTSSSMPATARAAISSSNQYSRAMYRIRFTR
jgi:hypothetical protein